MVLWLAEPHLTTFHIFIHIICDTDKNYWCKYRYKTKTKGLTLKFSLMPCKISWETKVSYFSNTVNTTFQIEIQIWTFAKSFAGVSLLWEKAVKQTLVHW